MTNRDKALEIAIEVLEYLGEPGPIEYRDITEEHLRLEIAKVFLLADISKKLEALNENIVAILVDGIGIGE